MNVVSSPAEFAQAASIPAQLDTETPRPEYPRPDFQRDPSSWLNLNGRWEFAFDDNQHGLAQRWQQRPHFDGRITVPFAFQSELSGIGDPSLHDYLWYARSFELPENWAGQPQRYLLHFGAVDYYCQVWVNGREVGSHRGGHVPFSFDITEVIKSGEPNRVVVYVEDTQSTTQPRGKQYWKQQSEGIYYVRTSGIWQTVWLEAVAPTYLHDLRLQTDIDREELDLAVSLNGSNLHEEIYWLRAVVSFDGETVWHGEFGLMQDEISLNSSFTGTIPISQARLWSPETPNLYDFKLTLYEGSRQLDEVTTYFGMRKISSEGGRVLLNNQPYYLRLILDQGYFPTSLLTAPSDEDLRRDIEITRAFGFNGARKHQKIEDPRWLYWADKLGLLVWGEMPSAIEWSPGGELPFIEEWLQAITRDYNHPCIMTWVPFNESWGVGQIARSAEQRDFIRRVVALTRDMDKTRLVVDNDGWEHLDAGDLLTIHDYTSHGDHLFERYSQFGRDGHEARLPLVSERPILLEEMPYRGEPVIFSEFGGISLVPPDHTMSDGEWSYSNATDSERLIEQYHGLVEALERLGFSSGFCYTQLTDVEQEINGLLTYDRRPKLDPARLAEINARLGRAFA